MGPYNIESFTTGLASYSGLHPSRFYLQLWSILQKTKTYATYIRRRKLYVRKREEIVILACTSGLDRAEDDAEDDAVVAFNLLHTYGDLRDGHADVIDLGGRKHTNCHSTGCTC